MLECGAGVAERRVDGFHLWNEAYFVSNSRVNKNAATLRVITRSPEPCRPYDYYVKPLRFDLVSNTSAIDPSGKAQAFDNTANPIKINDKIIQHIKHFISKYRKDYFD